MKMRNTQRSESTPIGRQNGWKKFREAAQPVFDELYNQVISNHEAQRSIASNSKWDYRKKLEEELYTLQDSEMWLTSIAIR